MQTSNFNRKREQEKKNAKRCIRANTACERRGWRRRRKLSKEVCQVLPSPAFVCERTSYLLLFYSFLFVRTYINARRAGILGNEIEKEREERERERAKTYNHPRSRRRDVDFRFRITNEEEQNIREREKGDGSGSIKQNWSAATCKQKKRRENVTTITTLYDDNLNETHT